ncbi:MAG: cytochrome c, partial [Thermoleophilia bacterium]|nr:cytochrome c [Thermoleophilia bacterium]
MSTAGRPSWPLLIGMLAVVTVAVYGLARLHPLQPSAPAAGDVAGGDTARGAELFQRTCAGCHGTGGAGGGIGPRLVDAGLDAPTVAGVIAAGRGAMPAGLLKDANAADVSAYVAGISGGAPPPASTGTGPAPGIPPAPAPDPGVVLLDGPRLTGLRVTLGVPPQDRPWGVWAQGARGTRILGFIPQGSRFTTIRDAGEGPLVDDVDRFLVGPTEDAPALAGTLSPARAERLRRLLV